MTITTTHTSIDRNTADNTVTYWFEVSAPYAGELEYAAPEGSATFGLQMPIDGKGEIVLLDSEGCPAEGHSDYNKIHRVLFNKVDEMFVE
ncbi:hypothetical protein FKD06_07840 [Serratia sp. SRS-8-S-2018]|uniref:hypothetical protein n=1 Tax=Serratia sp. SRS-8-S-2018 TaxID=2591107 RepID=UPI00113FC94E|nr:hypothetical protein [Serratia sp. SRS-8-S-2018]TPW52407.1 hypothetical protein FKD06_07840 [Serratia sp. SRS-8-S-2018]